MGVGRVQEVAVDAGKVEVVVDTAPFLGLQSAQTFFSFPLQSSLVCFVIVNGYLPFGASIES